MKKNALGRVQIMKLFTKCDGCCVLYEDEKEELKRIKTDGIQIVQ